MSNIPNLVNRINEELGLNEAATRYDRLAIPFQFKNLSASARSAKLSIAPSLQNENEISLNDPVEILFSKYLGSNLLAGKLKEDVTFEDHAWRYAVYCGFRLSWSAHDILGRF